jgi:hypothetical protein
VGGQGVNERKERRKSLKEERRDRGEIRNIKFFFHRLQAFRNFLRGTLEFPS